MPRSIRAGKFRDRSLVTKANTPTGPNRLGHWSGISQFNVESGRIRRKTKADSSPIPESVSFD
jgi:hypothetical protein